MPVFYENILIFGGHYLDNYIYALNKDTGKEIWKYYTGAYAASVNNSPVIHNDLIYALAGKLIHCLSLSGKKQWSFGLKKKVGYVNLVIDSDKIYAVTNEGMHKQELHCVDINKKELLWKIKTPNLGSNLLKIQDHLFYLNREAELCQVNLATQEIIKSKIINYENKIFSFYLAYHDGIMVIVVGYYILGLNIHTNPWSWQWNFHSSGVIGTPVIADNCIYFSTSRDGVYALDLHTGKQLLHTKSEVRSRFSCGVYDSKIFVAGSSNEHELTAYTDKKQD